MPLDKVILPREVAETLDSFIGGGMTSEEILRRALNGECEDLAYFSDKIDDLMRALVVGYEVEIEKTPEERLCEYYEYLLSCQKKHTHEGEYTKADARLDGFLKALELLGIKIEGILKSKGGTANDRT